MSDDEIKSPVGNEHPIAGCVVGCAIIVIAAAAIVAICSSCTAASPREGSHTTITNAVRIVAEVAVQVREARRDAEGEPSGVNSADPGQTAKPKATDAAPAILWSYGRVDGSKAVESEEARIGSFRMSKNGMSYRWEKGGCEALGAKDRSDYSRTLACAFYFDETANAWVGGKFDFVSTSRTTRSWNNVNDGYRGWKPEKFWAAKRHAFCILSVDGKKRTNLAEEGR